MNISIRISRIAAIASSAALVCGAFAQGLLQQASVLVTQPHVASDLKLSSTQIAKRSELLTTYEKRRVEIVEAMQTGTPEKSEALRADLDKVLTSLQKGLLGLLTPAQSKRLREIAIQQVGVDALMDDSVAKDLGLSAAQRSKILAAQSRISKADEQYQNAVASALSSLPDPGNDPDAIKVFSDKQQAIMKALKPKERQMLAVKAAGQKEMLSTLTPAQKKKWALLKGKPLKSG